MGERETLERLRELILGGVVERVELNQRTEGLLTLVVRRGTELRVIPIFATDLGWWIDGVRVQSSDAPSSYESPEAMLHSMADTASEFDYKITVVPLEDVARQRIGFKIVSSSHHSWEEFWIEVARCGGSPWSGPLRSEAGRQWIAEHPGTWLAADPREVRGIFAGDGPWRD